MGTILSDRRLYAVVAGVVLSMVGIPYTIHTGDSQTVTSIVAIVQGVVVLAGTLGLVKSWENRPPSGLKYKEVLQTFLATDSPVVTTIKALLEDAGVELEE